jgi:hypothetical protein
VSAVIGPTPGAVIRRAQTGSAVARFSSKGLDVQLLLDRFHGCDERREQGFEIGALRIKRGQAFGPPAGCSGGSHAQTEQL